VADNQEIILGRRVAKTPDNPKGYTTSDISFDKPTILVFGGGGSSNTTNEVKPQTYPNGYGKLVQMLLTGDQSKFPKDVQIIGAEYTEHYFDFEFRAKIREEMGKDFSFYGEEVERR